MRVLSQVCLQSEFNSSCATRLIVIANPTRNIGSGQRTGIEHSEGCLFWIYHLPSIAGGTPQLCKTSSPDIFPRESVSRASLFRWQPSLSACALWPPATPGLTPAAPQNCKISPTCTVSLCRYLVGLPLWRQTCPQRSLYPSRLSATVGS